MTFNDIKEYSIDDIQLLIDNGVEESVHLEFKQAGALAKSNSVIKEIAKDVSAFANSDGGVIIYGVEESDHKASALSYVDGNDFTKEWLENVISSNIQRKIDGLEVIPLRVNEEISKSIYIVKIPRSYNAPHMVSKDKDNRYYKRYNFKAALMEEYEVRDLFYRKECSKLVIASQKATYRIIDDRIRYTFYSTIRNESKTVESEYRLAWYINYDVSKIRGRRGVDEKYFMNMSDETLKIIIPNTHTIFPLEDIEMQKIELTLNVRNRRVFEENATVDLTLFYNGGEDAVNVKLKDILQRR